MGKQSIFDRLRSWIGGVGFQIFLWSIHMTQDQYIEYICEQEDSLHDY